MFHLPDRSARHDRRLEVSVEDEKPGIYLHTLLLHTAIKPKINTGNSRGHGQIHLCFVSIPHIVVVSNRLLTANTTTFQRSDHDLDVAILFAEGCNSFIASLVGHLSVVLHRLMSKCREST